MSSFFTESSIKNSLNQQKKRINIFSQVISIILMISGAVIFIVQVVKILPLLEYYAGWTWSLGNILGLIVGATLFLVGKQGVIKKSIIYALNSGREKMKRFVFTIPISLLLLMITFKVSLGHDSKTYIMMNTEGGVIEYGTSVAYILAFAFAIPVANSFLREKHQIWGILYYLFAFALLFVGLEEISWGQRLFGIESPEFFETYNSQDEITLHNLEWFRHYLHHGYIIIGFLGSFSWLVLRQIKEKFYAKRLKYFVPSWFLASFFFPAFIIFIILEYTNGFNFFILKDQEGVELILSLGFLFLVTTNFFRSSQT